MRACTHMAGFLGGDPVPVWDIFDTYEKDDVQNMLVSNTRLGASLAKAFRASEEEGDTADKNVVLM